MTFHLHLTGLVQGVGFRPFVWKLARSMKLNGTVSNGADGVHVYLNADTPTARQFRSRVLAEAPALARIQSATLTQSAPFVYADFSINSSQTDGIATLWLTPDLALCDACRAELTDPTNRRFGYAFTTCTHCGPRYSILQQLPYDRPTTTMASFGMCPECSAEYHDPANRRFYAQTNSCPRCAITIQLLDPSGACLSADTKTLIGRVADRLEQGQTVAVKGIGGYLLLCDATQATAISRLRERKHRPSKPLAVLYPSIDAIRQDFVLNTSEVDLLTGPVSPILLLERRADQVQHRLPDALAPGLDRLGVMLPYAPLLALIAAQFGKPLVATSGNRSGSPIAYNDERATSATGSDNLFAVADFILTHNRPIAGPQDDSVMQVSPVYEQPIVLRRSRGLAPTLVSTITDASTNVLALGASLKSTFAWQLRGNVYVSQYLGDLESYDTQTNYQATLDHFLNVFGTRPDCLLADQHEGYFSTQLAQHLAGSWQVPLHLIQHHEAHFAAVLAENKLEQTDEPVLGIIWDGTGYGTDGQIWGGEFMIYHQHSFRRLVHIEYIPVLLGDKMPREPRLSALSVAYGLPGASELLRPKFTAAEWSLYPKLLQASKLKTSSMGRLFDAVASLLGLIDCVSYEGEAALLLETCASRYVRRHGFRMDYTYPLAIAGSPEIATRSIVAGVLADKQAGTPVDEMAARFHATLVALVAAITHRQESRQLAFSGGVFQNALLVDWLHHELDSTCQLYFHRQLSPNDESISFGQLARFSLDQDSFSGLQTEKKHVFSHSR